MGPRIRRELHDLLSALLDGALTPAQESRLGDLLRQEAQARDLYLAYFALHGQLALRGDAGPVAADGSLRRPRRLRRAAWAVLGLGCVAAGLLLALAFWPRTPPSLVPPAPPGPPAEPMHATIAFLLQAPGAEWEETGLPTRVGSPLPAGRLRLKSGLAHIEFYSGATVILQ